MEDDNCKSKCALGCCTFLLYVVHVVLGITAASISTGDTYAMNQTYGVEFYKELPLVTIFLPNPFTPAVIAFVPKCEDFNNCDEPYTDLFVDSRLLL